MPLDDFGRNYENEKNDIKRILDFLYALKIQLNYFFENYEILMRNYPESKIYFIKAWDEVKPNFEKIESNLHRDDINIRLSKVGLTGAQLTLKLHVYYLTLNKIKNAEMDYRRRTFRGRARTGGRWRKYFGWALEHGDTILGSLGEAGVPGVGVISEFKQVAEKLSKQTKA